MLNNENKSFGELIRDLRMSKGIQQEEVAECLQITSPYLSQIETGVRPPPPSIQSAFRVAHRIDSSSWLAIAYAQAKEREEIRIDLTDVPEAVCKDLILVIKNTLEKGKSLWHLKAERVK